MSATVLIQRRARPGQEAALLATAARRLEWESRRHWAHTLRLFQGRDDPALLLRVAEWESRAAYERSRQEADASELDALCVGPPERYVCDWLLGYTDVTSPPALVTCTLLEVPPANGDALAAFLRDVTRSVVRALPGVVFRRVYRDQDAPYRCFVLLGWQSPEARDQALPTIMPDYEAGLRALDTESMRFIAVPRVQVERRRR